MIKTLSGRDYHAADVFDVERERIFARNWYYAGREEGLAQAGDFVTVDVAGESVIVLRAKDGDLHAFYNVCRHRGSRLCDDASGRMKGAVKCPYHAWSYSFDGRLIGTPNVAAGEVVFVHLDPEPAPLESWLGGQHDGPIDFARFSLDELRIGHARRVARSRSTRRREPARACASPSHSSSQRAVAPRRLGEAPERVVCGSPDRRISITVFPNTSRARPSIIGLWTIPTQVRCSRTRRRHGMRPARRGLRST